MVQAMDEEKERPSLPRSSSQSTGKSSDVAPPRASPRAVSKKPSDIEMMKKKFAMLLLGGDMSGSGKGESSALALSNAITNLAGPIFGGRLEPMSVDKRCMWRKEIDWLLSVTDHISELVPLKEMVDGKVVERMDRVVRADLHIIPVLRGLDGTLIDCLDRFKDQTEFTYPSDENHGAKGEWWTPKPKVVSKSGLSEPFLKFLKSQRETANQVLKAAMTVNSRVLQEMDVPESYIDSLPKNGKTWLGDATYRSMAEEEFQVDTFLKSVDLTTEHRVLDFKNKIEGTIEIWKRKITTAKDSKSSWGSMSTEKREQFDGRAKQILQRLQENYPGLAQSSLDMSKIQCNKDVGHAILESYSRIIESLAHTVMSRIDDVLEAHEKAMETHADVLNRKQADEGSRKLVNSLGELLESDSTEMEELSGEIDQKLKSQDKPNVNRSYLARLGGSRSPTSRH